MQYACLCKHENRTINNFKVRLNSYFALYRPALYINQFLPLFNLCVDDTLCFVEEFFYHLNFYTLYLVQCIFTAYVVQSILLQAFSVYPAKARSIESSHGNRKQALHHWALRELHVHPRHAVLHQNDGLPIRIRPFSLYCYCRRICFAAQPRNRTMSMMFRSA